MRSSPLLDSTWAVKDRIGRRLGWAAMFVLKQTSSGKFHFNLVATNGQVIATGQTYESKASALDGIESVRRSAPTAEVEDQTGG
jgi:uncharacterized protein YegP (UPF0339 family)